MIRLALLALGLSPLSFSARAADEAKGEKVEYTVYDGYFEKNNAGLKGDASFLALTDKDAFDKVFAARPPLMGGKKAVLLANDTFDKHLVAAVVKRGNAITTYKVEAVTLDGDTLNVRYKATTGPAGTATFASPLIVTAPKDKVKKVAFIENGKAAGTAEVK
ncbi:hypothetical protein [Frigoriglobus tundricola]|uniref:Uncharacterized protein n=1 Tax=Frigoriglobus tundricola TaxID=2774151 RepID=A0A6M5YHM3_9BACT|nr:hypothetical protein [Frigoriglobus tundricola]QJW92766.1 hypothetical protein FTUN_0263 [Frigoriglobus tundricola]